MAPELLNMRLNKLVELSDSYAGRIRMIGLDFDKLEELAGMLEWRSFVVAVCMRMVCNLDVQLYDKRLD